MPETKDLVGEWITSFTDKYELAPGELIPEAPTCPEGYYWHPYPYIRSYSSTKV